MRTKEKHSNGNCTNQGPNVHLTLFDKDSEKMYVTEIPDYSSMELVSSLLKRHFTIFHQYDLKNNADICHSFIVKHYL